MAQNPFLDTPQQDPRGAPASSGNPFLDGGTVPVTHAAVTAPSTESGGGSALGLGLGAAALAALGYAAHVNPGVLGKIAKTAGAVRMQEMLSGLAPIKSLLGNAGAALTESIEGGTMAPIKEVFSGKTLADAKAAWDRGTAAGGTTLKVFGHELPTPGRFMGALDDATQNALVRSGLSTEKAQRAVLQTPLGVNYGKFGTALDNPIMDYEMPFRRTPFNQLYEGGAAMTRAAKGGAEASGARRALAVYGTAGAVHGAATSDDKAPLSIPLAIAASGRYGLPYGLAAIAGRALGGGTGSGNIAGNVLPVSEYGITQGIQDPLRPYVNPAMFGALEKVFGGK
jgi:hypothetical protein